MSATGWNRKQLILTVGIIALISLVIVQAYALAVLMPARANNVTNTTTSSGTQNTITVLGTGHASVQPDTAIVTVGVLTQDSTVQAAVQSNANTMSQVISGLNNIGIDNSNIQTTYYSVSPIYSNSPPTTTGYSVSNQIQVTIVSSGQNVAQLSSKAGQVIDNSVSNGANQLNGVQFTASQTVYQQAQQTALTNAGKDASQRAHTLASALGATITGLVSVSQSNAYYTPPVYLASVSLSGTPIVAPQSLSITETVQAVYSIG